MDSKFLFRVVLTAILTSMGFAASTQTVFHEQFNEPSLSSNWKVDAAEGNTVSVTDGALKISARKNTYAHIQRSIDEDLIRASFTVTPDAAVSWAPSLFLYWNPANWCQTSVIKRAGGVVHVAEMIDGKFIERDLQSVSMEGSNQLGIELAVDCLRYVIREIDQWKVLSVQQRPEQFRPAPSLLIAGKGFGGSAGMMQPDLNNNYSSPEEQVQSSIDNILVEKLELARIMESKEERQARLAVLEDQAGKKELARATDPDFESVASHYPPLKFSREVIGIKDHHDGIGVAANGSLQLSEGITETSNPVVYFTVGHHELIFGQGSKLPTKKLAGGWMPIVTATDSFGDITVEQTAFGYSDTMTTATPLWACVGLKISGTTSKLPIRLVLQQGGTTKVLKSWEVDATSSTEQVRVCVPYDINATAVREISADEYGKKLQQVSDYWEKLIGPAMKFQVPEERVQNAYRTWLSYNFLNVKQRGDIRHICDGTGFYNIIYGYSAALFCHVLDLYGYTDQSREYLDEMLTLQQKDGLWHVNYGHTDTGTIMKVIAEHYRITNDDAWLRKTAPRIMAMHAWIAQHRKESMSSVHGRRSPVHGLIRFRPYCDYEAPAFDYYSNSYLCVGLEEAAEVLARIGMTSESRKLADEARVYRQDILASMDASTLTHDGTRMLPLFPENKFLLQESNYTANGYYGLVASCLLETAFLPEWDRRTQLIMDMMEKRGGLSAGVCRFFDQIDHAYTYGYWQTCMRRDLPKPVVLGLYGSMAYGMSRDTYAAVECTPIKTGENAHTLPHTYSNSKQLRLLRNMMVRETSDELQLLNFIPEKWLEPGKTISMKDVPTSFGLMSMEVKTEESGGALKVSVNLQPPVRTAPEKIKLRLRAAGKTAGEIQGVVASKPVIAGQDLVFTRLAGPVQFTVTMK